ncbi:MAG: Flp family type IVb pilin [Acidobacteriaceae bacterium]|nr:Flp family type IVb pilin [Acidobacteriaceae bacterium]MBV9442395.1 Flp family type IVb pilin [Acidobacteriaceae bacterium]
MFNSALAAFWNEEEGQDLVEYSLLLAFIALAAVSVLSSVKGSITNIWSAINTNMNAAATAATSGS